MYSAEVLSQLRSLNWSTVEIRRVPADSPEFIHLRSQMDAIRARLPNSILSYHDRLIARGQVSAAQASGTNCSACHLKLPHGLLGELTVPGHFGVCPNCGVFLWAGDELAPSVATPSKRNTSRVAHV